MKTKEAKTRHYRRMMFSRKSNSMAKRILTGAKVPKVKKVVEAVIPMDKFLKALDGDDVFKKVVIDTREKKDVPSIP